LDQIERFSSKIGAIPTDIADEFIELSQSDEVTPSMLFDYNVLGVQSTLSSINYKYRRVRGNIKVSIASERVRQLLSIKYWSEIMNVLNPKSLLYQIYFDAHLRNERSRREVFVSIE
jgi:hypothetical protein